MRMKEKKVLLFLALMFLCICSPMRAEARAGGASGGSSGGGGGFSSGGGSYYSSHSNRTGRSSSPVSSVVMFGGFFLMANAGVVLFFGQIQKGIFQKLPGDEAVSAVWGQLGYQ